MNPRFAGVFRRPARAALVAEIAALLGIGAIPAKVGSSAVVLLVAYVAAVQSSTFVRLRRWPFSSVITTGNLRTATRAAYHAVLLKEPAAEEARCFAAICFAFFAGAFLGALATYRFGNSAAWIAAALLAAALSLFALDETWVGRRRPVSMG